MPPNDARAALVATFRAIWKDLNTPEESLLEYADDIIEALAAEGYRISDMESPVKTEHLEAIVDAHAQRIATLERALRGGMPDLTGKLMVEIPCRDACSSGSISILVNSVEGDWRRTQRCERCKGAGVEHITPEAYCELRDEHPPAKEHADADTPS